MATFEDLSGVRGDSNGVSSNPYDALIAACNDNPKSIQTRYETHRTVRNAQQKAKLLADDFSGVVIDPILHALETQPRFEDPRNCLVFWARPPVNVRELVAKVQRRLREVMPKLWLMPLPNLHMTALEITHSKTAPEIASLVDLLAPSAGDIVNYTSTHRTHLIKPQIGYDTSAIALSFVPAAREATPVGDAVDEDTFTYHHLRRDLYALAEAAGVAVASRYVVPSAHLTVGRFVHAEELSVDGDILNGVDREKMRQVVGRIEEINSWLREEYWPKEAGREIKEGGEWVVGEERGLDCRKGRLWYGDGETVVIGKGFGRK
ncbi:hypothetical protein P152DRAFT_439350 [Eremomyces bilateralis CBS 781.70]|uniref:RNA ligase/cyclic nucleotide phosphodiesterase n=1 Tax=Eremomyces bilateralis CBS 781.70 TaxID=1392243 RepID=A0A6G1FYY5_9PEZI|nr:uncharacterized protein P152DRAFT_439350 [Eremomyces bilateralis CBS 781.70]KAF1810911.1 hypothetical protein P152DRAFT_439350 [Eremomyces bilateralis CBS 781.70]